MTNREIPIKPEVLESLCKILADTNNGLTGSELAKILVDSKIEDIDPSLTKWKRLYNAFVNFQNKEQTSNNILTFIQKAINPVRFLNEREKFEDLRIEINKILSFIGLELSESAQFRKVDRSQTISDALNRANKLKSKLENRGVHSDVFLFCKAELLNENYFHAVFEATKSVAEKIRNLTGLTTDGSALIDESFKIANPLIKINKLETETEENEHKGFANLLKGIFGMFRNTTAHSPKIKWEILEEDALDLMSLVSLAHRKLDNSINFS